MRLENECPISRSYECLLCRGEKVERMDAFHKRNRTKKDDE